MPFFDRFDILEAYYIFGCQYSAGQFSKEYKYICRAIAVGFKPASNLNVNSLSYNGREIYDNLVNESKNYVQPKKLTNRLAG